LLLRAARRCAQARPGQAGEQAHFKNQNHGLSTCPTPAFYISLPVVVQLLLALAFMFSPFSLVLASPRLLTFIFLSSLS
jgi:hypothetical protein